MEAKEREQVRQRVKRYRERQKAGKSVTNAVRNVTLDVTQYHPILEYLVEKRDKLERICHSLRQHNQLGEVYFGCRQPLSFDIVEGLLQATS